MIDEPMTSQQAEVASVQQKPQQIIREYKIPHRRFGKQRTPPKKWYPSVPTVPITAEIQPRTTDEVIIINYFNRAHLNFDPRILGQATAALQQIAQDFPDYFQARWMCNYYKYYGAENAIVITQLTLFLFHAHQAYDYKTTDNPYWMALRYILQCLTNRRALNYPATQKRKAIIQEIHCEYQMEMDERAEEKKRKDGMTLTEPAVPPKYQMMPAPIIAMTTTTTTQPTVIGIGTLLGAAQQALAPQAPTTSQGLQMPPPSILKLATA
uniref:Uncharacterized protein n=1 Tax=Romanomermis culicivorax TaxID=13658 RepID=A0A915IN98_ROMCU